MLKKLVADYAIQIPIHLSLGDYVLYAHPHFSFPFMDGEGMRRSQRGYTWNTSLPTDYFNLVMQCPDWSFKKQGESLLSPVMFSLKLKREKIEAFIQAFSIETQPLDEEVLKH